jgi:hypothetical protein
MTIPTEAALVVAVLQFAGILVTQSLRVFLKLRKSQRKRRLLQRNQLLEPEEVPQQRRPPQPERPRRRSSRNLRNASPSSKTSTSRLRQRLGRLVPKSPRKRKEEETEEELVDPEIPVTTPELENLRKQKPFLTRARVAGIWTAVLELLVLRLLLRDVALLPGDLEVLSIVAYMTSSLLLKELSCQLVERWAGASSSPPSSEKFTGE